MPARRWRVNLGRAVSGYRRGPTRIGCGSRWRITAQGCPEGRYQGRGVQSGDQPDLARTRSGLWCRAGSLKRMAGPRAPAPPGVVVRAAPSSRLPSRREDTPSVSGPTDAPEDPPVRHGKAALIVDDEEDVGLLLSEMLAVQGFHCDVANAGAAAKALLLRRDYDAILCDVRMPDIDGPALYAWMSEQKPHLCGRTAFITGDTFRCAAVCVLTRSDGRWRSLADLRRWPSGRPSDME